jgi:uncharacterized cysteine cluster protein YcgN (CxxCxxCC family)
MSPWWNKPLDEMSVSEWEALCDGCGKCCLLKLEDEDTGAVHYTRIGCRLLDGEACRCTDYARRLQKVPGCVRLTPEALAESGHWMPRTCAYRLLSEGQTLPEWHPLITGDPESVHRAGISVRGMTVPESMVDEADYDLHTISDLH